MDCPFIEKGYGLYNITLRPKGARGSAQTEIWRFTMDIFVCKWLLLVIGEIISKNCIYLLLNSTG